tara:strand:- start:131 stop:1360 length:1230 start_codon:yes stop_codon:yes gene_type:complete
MVKIKAALLMIIFSCFLSKAQSRFTCTCESQKGQFYSGENINACFHAIEFVDTLLLPTKIKKEGSGSQLINTVYRFSKLLLINYRLSDYIMTMNHERFGHGYRALQAGGDIIGITYNPPPPFGNEFSFITIGGLGRATNQERLLMTLGGSEANMVVSDIMRKNFLLDGSLNYNFAVAYLYGSNDMPGYTAFVKNEFSDPNTYRRNVNEFYFQRESLTKSRMRVISLVALFTDPFNFYSMKSLFYDYLLFGKLSTEIKFIPIFENIGLLPRFRFEYTPYGPELVYQSYFKKGHELYQTSFSHGDGTFYSSWRIGVRAWNLNPTGQLSFNLSAELWDQPQIDFYTYDGLVRNSGIGGLFNATANYDFFTNKGAFSFLGATLQAGYKTAGYSLGEQLRGGLILRGGLSFRLR